MCIHIMVDDIYFSHLANIIHCSSLPPRPHQEFISEISGIASGEFALEQQLQKARGGNQLGVAIAQKNSTMAQWLVIW